MSDEILDPKIIEAVQQALSTSKKDVTDEIGLSRTVQGTIARSSLRNIELLLENDEMFKGRIAYNQFTNAPEVTDDFVVERILVNKGEINEALFNAVRIYFETKYDVLFSEPLVITAIKNVARRQLFNPVADYLNRAYSAWDGRPRIAKLMPEYLGVEENDTTELITRLFLTGAVSKVFEEDSKFDYTLDLVGGQGAGKTTLLYKLAIGYYTDQFTTFDNKDDFSKMIRAWIINDDEMVATKRTDFETLKRFVTARELEFRPPYDRTNIRTAKNFVIARTSNNVTYLMDKTGDRRFLPLLVRKSKRTKNPMELTDREVMQIWGEAMDWYRRALDGEWTMIEDDARLEMFDDYRQAFMYVDETENALNEFLDNNDLDFVTSSDIADGAFNGANLIRERTLAQKIKYLMDNRKGWTAGASLIGGKSKRGWRKKS